MRVLLSDPANRVFASNPSGSQWALVTVVGVVVFVVLLCILLLRVAKERDYGDEDGYCMPSWCGAFILSTVVAFLVAGGVLVYFIGSEGHKRQKEAIRLYNEIDYTYEKPIKSFYSDGAYIIVTCEDGTSEYVTRGSVGLGDSVKLVMYADQYCQDEHFYAFYMTEDVAKEFGIVFGG